MTDFISLKIDPSIISERLSRIITLSGSDEGFYVLALHSFIEKYIQEICPDLDNKESFGSKMYYFIEYLKTENKSNKGVLDILVIIGGKLQKITGIKLQISA